MRITTDLVFRVGMALKGIDSLFEVAGGILLTMPTRLARYITLLSEHETFRHHEALAGRLDRLANTVVMHPNMQEAAYLAVHGLAKLILIIAIFRNKKWGYSGLFWILSLFAIIELIRAVTHGEIVTGAFAAFDGLLVVLIYKEYKSRFPDASVSPPKGDGGSSG